MQWNMLENRFRQFMKMLNNEFNILKLVKKIDKKINDIEFF